MCILTLILFLSLPDFQIAFLDVLVKRSGTLMCITRKHTCTFAPITHHHPGVLSGVVKCLYNRAVKICDQSSMGQEIQHLRDTFLTNRFPAKVTELILNKNRTQSRPQLNQTLSISLKQCTVCLPYVMGTSERIAWFCKTITSSRIQIRAVLNRFIPFDNRL